MQAVEFSDNTGLELYDYGARLQDPQLGRWWTIDAFAEKFYHETPYNYAGDNPVNLIDEGGNFKMKPSDQKRYSVLAGYLKNGISEILGSKNIMNALMKYGSFSKKDILNKLIKWGEGSIGIDFISMADNVSGYYMGGKGRNIRINKKLAQQLQNANPEDRQAALLAIISTILHESTHRGDWDANGFPNENQFIYYNEDGTISALSNEVGKAFEIAAYHKGNFNENENSQKLGLEGIRNMKKIIHRKEASEEDKKDLPNIIGTSAANLINSAMRQNPSIKLYTGTL